MKSRCLRKVENCYADYIQHLHAAYQVQITFTRNVFSMENRQARRFKRNVDQPKNSVLCLTPFVHPICTFYFSFFSSFSFPYLS